MLARRIRGERAYDRRDLNLKGDTNEVYYHLPYFNAKDGMEALRSILG